jgi:hypothetical protein
MLTIHLQDIIHSNDDIDVNACRALLPRIREDPPVPFQGKTVRGLSDNCSDACCN